MKPSYVYDIETEDWTTFVLGALYDGKTVEVYDWTREREFAERMLSLEGEVYAHNGGRFDHLWLLDAAYRFGIKRHATVMENSTGIIALNFGDLKFLDSYRLFPMSLRKLTNGAKDNLSDLCKCGRECGGYCAIRRNMPPTVKARVRDYLVTDVQSLWVALDDFQRLSNEAGITLGLTIGGTSWKSAKAELSLPPQPYANVNDWRFVRQGYFGGRVEIFRTQVDAGEQYDVNSMYPAKIASVPLPVDYIGRVSGGSAGKAYRDGKPGVYRAKVRIPDSFIPPLPIRSPKKGRVLFPTGDIVGTWALPELQYAESVGVRVEYVSEAAIFARTEILFDTWVERLFNLRMKYGKDSREGAWFKLILNSITGKFGAKVTQRSYVIDPCFSKHCDLSDCRKIGPVGLQPCGNPATSRVWYREFERIQKCAHVEWAAYLTASARVTLHKGLTEGNKGDAIYCDTDSVFSVHPRKENVGLDLGQWKHEASFSEFLAIAPKVYTYHRLVDGKDKQTIKAKGIPVPNPLPKNFWRDLMAGKPINYWSIAGIRNPVDGLFFIRRELSRHVNFNLGGRLRLTDTLTRAPTAREVESF